MDVAPGPRPRFGSMTVQVFAPVTGSPHKATRFAEESTPGLRTGRVFRVDRG